MHQRKWTTTAFAVVVAGGIGAFVGCDQQASDTYQYPEGPSDTAAPTSPQSPGDTNADADADNNVGDVGTMGTTRDQGMIGGESTPSDQQDTNTSPTNP